METKTKIKIISDCHFKEEQICGVKHLYYEFNKNKFKRETLLFLNLHEHYNNLEILKFSLLCKLYNTKLVVYTHINEFPLISTFADAAILYISDTKEIYDHITRYNYDRDVVGKLFNQFLSSPHGLSDAIALSRVESQNWPLLLEIANDIVSDDEVVENFCFPKICIKETSYQKYLEISKELKQNLIVCEVKTSEEKPLGYDTGESFLENIKNSSGNYPLEIVTEKTKNKKLAKMCGQDYMGVQVLCSFLKNWMWICYGGSSNIFPFFPVKILSLTDQTLCKELIRKISIKRFGDLGNIFPEYDSLIYCLPSEKDGKSRKDGQKPLPNLKKLSIDFSNQKLNFEIIF